MSAGAEYNYVVLGFRLAWFECFNGDGTAMDAAKDAVVIVEEASEIPAGDAD